MALKRKQGTKQLPKEGEQKNNLQPEDVRDKYLNFYVTESFKREFKTFAAANGMKLYELLETAFHEYKKTR